MFCTYCVHKKEKESLFITTGDAESLAASSGPTVGGAAQLLPFGNKMEGRCCTTLILMRFYHREPMCFEIRSWSGGSGEWTGREAKERAWYFSWRLILQEALQHIVCRPDTETCLQLQYCHNDMMSSSNSSRCCDPTVLMRAADVSAIEAFADLMMLSTKHL